MYEVHKEDGKIRSLDEWIREANLNNNSMVSFLAQMYNSDDLMPIYYAPSLSDFENVKRMLEEFYFVGLTEEKDDIQFV